MIRRAATPTDIDDKLLPGYDGVDTSDPFGGNDGRNQARIVPGGPVQVYAPGFRNGYDIVLTQAGRLYTFDNGPNNPLGWHSRRRGHAGQLHQRAERDEQHRLRRQPALRLAAPATTAATRTRHARTPRTATS